MPISLGANADSQITTLENSLTSGGSTQFASRMIAFIKATFASATNVFGTAATRNIGQLSGQLPELAGEANAAGEFPPAVLPMADETDRGAVVRAGLAEHTLTAADETKHATLAGVARVGNAAVAAIPAQYQTFARWFLVDRTGAAPQYTFTFTPPAGTDRIQGYIVGGGGVTNGVLNQTDTGRRATTGVVVFVDYIVPTPAVAVTLTVGRRGETGANGDGSGRGRWDGRATTFRAGALNLATAPGGRIIHIGGSSNQYVNFQNDNAFADGYSVPASGSAVGEDLGPVALRGVGPTLNNFGLFGTRWGSPHNDGAAVLWGVRGDPLTLTVT